MNSSRFWRYMIRVAYALLSIMAASLAIDILFMEKKPRPASDDPTIQKNELLPPTSIPFSLPVMPAKKAASGKRVAAFVSIPILIAIVAITFLFSVRYYSGVLAQGIPAQARVAAGKPRAVPTMFERGIIYPQWTSTGYSNQDSVWQQAIDPIKTQTGAQWIEIPVLFSQATPSSLSVEVSQSAPSVESFNEGIQRAHALGYHVFFVPLMQVRISGDWSGSITFNSVQQEQAWFDAYWSAIQPYVNVAATNHVEQMAIGTELQTLQQIAPEPLWNQLIARIHGTFPYTLTYDMNWSSLATPIPSWFKNSSLTYIGVSSYIPMVNTPTRVDPSVMPTLWQQKIGTQLDILSTQIGKQVIISEIGYRNSADALYHTWEATSNVQSDPAEQAGAYNATLTNALHDTHIAGTFFWGWNDVGMFAIANQPAVQVLQKWYTTHL